MTLRRPRWSSTNPPESALDYEIAQEQAATLGRLGRALEAALAALSTYDSAHDQRAQTAAARVSCASPPRQQLVQDAGYALWCFVIQREACGLRDQRLIVHEYGITAEVQNRMGVFDGSGRSRSVESKLTIS